MSETETIVPPVKAQPIQSAALTPDPAPPVDVVPPRKGKGKGKGDKEQSSPAKLATDTLSELGNAQRASTDARERIQAAAYELANCFDPNVEDRLIARIQAARPVRLGAGKRLIAADKMFCGLTHPQTGQAAGLSIRHQFHRKPDADFPAQIRVQVDSRGVYFADATGATWWTALTKSAMRVKHRASL